MTTEEQLREKLRKITALFEGASTAGERQAAASAMERMHQALGAKPKIEPSVETKFSLGDQCIAASLQRSAAVTASSLIATRASAELR